MRSDQNNNNHNKLSYLNTRITSLKEKYPHLSEEGANEFHHLRSFISEKIKEKELLVESISTNVSEVKKIQEVINREDPSKSEIDQFEKQKNILDEKMKLLDQLRIEIKYSYDKICKFKNDEYKEFISLLAERDKILRELNDNKNQASVFGLERNTTSKGIALTKANLITHVRQHLSSEWGKDFCKKYELGILDANSKNNIQLTSKNKDLSIIIDEHSIKGNCIDKNNENMIDSIVELYAKSRTNGNAITNHIITHSDPDILAKTEQKLAIAFQTLGKFEKINGKSLDLILHDKPNSLLVERNTNKEVSEQLDEPRDFRLR